MKQNELLPLFQLVLETKEELQTCQLDFSVFQYWPGSCLGIVSVH